MTETIDIHDLPEQDVKFIQELVELLRDKAKVRKVRSRKKKMVEFSLVAHPSDVTGKLTRREIYDYL